MLAGCQQGDDAAWRMLFEHFADRIYRWAVLLGLPGADAEDAAQEVLVTAARRIGMVRADAALTTWLYQITRRVVANHRRRRWFRSMLPGGDGGRSESGTVEPAFESRGGLDAADELAVRTCLDRLSAREREVLVLCDVEQFTREEVARLLGIPPGTVASRLRTARAAFRRAWGR